MGALRRSERFKDPERTAGRRSAIPPLPPLLAGEQRQDSGVPPPTPTAFPLGSALDLPFPQPLGFLSKLPALASARVPTPFLPPAPARPSPPGVPASPSPPLAAQSGWGSSTQGLSPCPPPRRPLRLSPPPQQVSDAAVQTPGSMPHWSRRRPHPVGSGGKKGQERRERGSQGEDWKGGVIHPDDTWWPGSLGHGLGSPGAVFGLQSPVPRAGGRRRGHPHLAGAAPRTATLARRRLSCRLVSAAPPGCGALIQTLDLCVPASIEGMPPRGRV